jgi:hypothetical protein
MHRLFAPEPLQTQCNRRFLRFAEQSSWMLPKAAFEAAMLQHGHSIYVAEIDRFPRSGDATR